MNPTQHIKMKGRLKVDVIDHLGHVVREGQWQNNLILDQGLNALADNVFCDLFRVAVKGNDTAVMREEVPAPNVYSLTIPIAQPYGLLTKAAAGSRVFTPIDQGKTVTVVVGSNVVDCRIQPDPSGFIDATHVNVEAIVPINGLTTYSSKAITIYDTNKVGMITEQSRTSNYSLLAGENTTTTANGNQRTFKRTFIFDPEPENKEVVPGTEQYQWLGGSPAQITRMTGTRNFTTADEGKYIRFPATGEYAKINTRVSNTVVNVDRNPVALHPAMSIELYGSNSYSHIGFSHLDAPGDNLNILTKLVTGGGADAPVIALGANPETPGQQVKVTYQMLVTFGPNTILPLGNVFTGDTSVMNGTKTGNYVLEAIASSTVATDGTTSIEGAGLEPSIPGSAAVSGTTEALVPLTATSNPPDRSVNASVVDATNDPYVPNSLSRTSTAVFGINDGNLNPWHTLGLFDQDSSQMLLTFKFNAAQKKPPTHQLSLHFRKTWSRDY